jgi:beta-lactamase superfamily II metal-dependent hydrolase
MDNGHSKSWKRINKYLQKEVKSKSLDLYISHNHGDHIGAYKKLFEAYKVNTVYLSYAEYTLFIEEKDKKKKTNLVDIFLNAAKGTKSEGPTIKYLSYTAKANANSPTSKFYIGNATVTIIGAIVNKKLEKTKGTNAYENNMSLVAKVKGGGMTYLSCGDIQENSAKNNKTGGQELILAGSNNTSVLKADIMKLSHHGIRKPVKGKYMLSNSTDILELVKPKISFIQTKGNMDTLEHKKE